MKLSRSLTERQKTLILFLGTGDSGKIDPIRIMKALFLFGQETPKDWLPTEARYDFIPYSYGPCAFEIYSDLDLLQAYGYIESTKVLGRSWNYYSLSEKGSELFVDLSKELDPRALNYLEAIRNFVSKLPFRKLLQSIYKHYPDYAKNSVFKR